MNHLILWEGFFSYEGVNEAGDSIEQKVPFTMQLVFDKNSFEGTRIDAETKDHITEPITVKGFVTGEFINYTVQYPYAYFIDDETGETVLEEDTPYPGVTYTGEYDQKEKAYFGEWTVILGEEKLGLFQEDTIAESWSGRWQMRRVR